MGGGGDPDIACHGMCQGLPELMGNGDDEVMNFAWAEEQLQKLLHSGLHGVYDEFNTFCRCNLHFDEPSALIGQL